jgi:hypothetical protein
MSRTALLGTFVFVVAGLSGCASPARMVDYDKSSAKVVIAIPEDTNSWPFYYQDEAVREASLKIPDPELVKTTRVKVGEQTTSTQDTSRRELGGRRPGELLSSISSSSTSDKYEYHLEFVSQTAGRLPGFVKSATPPAPIPNGPVDPMMRPASATVTPGSPPPADGIQMPVLPPTSPAMAPVSPSSPVIPPGSPSTDLPPTTLTPRGK